MAQLTALMEGCEPSIGTSIVEKGVVNLNTLQYGYPNFINYSSEKNL
jgi:hypothetical protein